MESQFRKTIEETTVLLLAGKGGVGKSTLSASVAIAAALLGRNVALVQLAPSSASTNLAKAIDEDDETISKVKDLISIVSLKPEDILIEYLEDHGLSMLGRRLISSGVVTVIATAIPGIKELLILAKIKQMERSQSYETIILDSPASGHLITFLSSSKGLTDIANVGLLRSQAEDVTELLNDPNRCKVILITIPEETPVEETVQTINKIKDIGDITFGPILINGVLPDQQISPAARVLISDNAATAGEFAAYEYLESRRAMQDKNIESLSHKLGNAAYIQLPQMFADEIGIKQQFELARLIIANEKLPQ